jgi:hypothetical protein
MLQRNNIVAVQLNDRKIVSQGGFSVAAKQYARE